MKHKALKICAIVIVALALVVYLACDLFLGSMVASGVKRYGSQLTQTPVNLTYAHISPLSGGGTLKGLTVGNPQGWSAQNAFSLGSIHIEVVPSSIFGDHIIVNDITVEDPKFDYETKLVSSNIGQLLKNIESGSGNGADKAKTTGGKPIKYEIKRLRVIGGVVMVGFGPTAMTLPLPPIDLTDLGTGGNGITSDELAVVLMRTLTTDVIQATTHAAGKIGATMGAAAGDTAKKAAQGLQDLLGK